jgi:hypothetical protein
MVANRVYYPFWSSYDVTFMCQSRSTIFPRILIFVIFRLGGYARIHFYVQYSLEWIVNSIYMTCRISRFQDGRSLNNYITIFLAEGIWKVHIFRLLFVCFQTSVYTLGEFHQNRNNYCLWRITIHKTKIVMISSRLLLIRPLPPKATLLLYQIRQGQHCHEFQ